MSSPETVSRALAPVYGSRVLSAREQRLTHIPPCILDYDGSPFFDMKSGLWFYGNFKLLEAKLAHVAAACGPNCHSSAQLDAIEAEAERLVLDSKVLVCGFHK